MSHLDEDQASTIRPTPDDLSDNDDDDDDDDRYAQDGDYSSRIDEFLSEGDVDEGDDDDDDDDTDFLYTGVDAQLSSETYRDQLRDVLGPEHDENEGSEVEKSMSAERENLVLPDDVIVSTMRTRYQGEK